MQGYFKQDRNRHKTNRSYVIFKYKQHSISQNNLSIAKINID